MRPASTGPARTPWVGLIVATTWVATASPAPADAHELIAWPIDAADQEPGLNVLAPWITTPGRLPPIPQPDPVRPPPVPGPIPHPTPPPPPTALRPLPLKSYSVEGTIQDQIAQLDFHITFSNPTSQRMEGVLLVPIPADTALSRFSMTVAGRTMHGELLEADRAAAIYQTIVRQMRDPGLLELVGERLMRARVFPIEPYGDVDIHLTMTQLLRKTGETVNLAIPVRSARFLEGAPGHVRIHLNLESTQPLRTLFSPVSGVDIVRHDERRATVRFEDDPSRLESDVLLFYSMQANPLATSLLAYREEGEDGYFLLTLSPQAEADSAPSLPKDIVFLVDRSGSMTQDHRMEQARAALRFCVKGLDPGDRFAMVDFATDVSRFEPRLVPATPDHIARGLRYIDRLEAGGGTNIEEALDAGMELLAPGGRERAGTAGVERLPMLFLLTDGLPTIGTTDTSELLRKVRLANGALNARIFSFGVGSDVNTLFLDTLAQEHRGVQEYVLPGETIDHKVSSLYQKISRPSLSDLEIVWQGVEVSQLYPRKVADLFAGEELVLLGRYSTAGTGILRVTGTSASGRRSVEVPVELPAERLGTEFLPRLWAHRKVASELDAIRLTGRADPEVVQEIVRLAKRHGLVTPYTSYLITEDGQGARAATRLGEAMARRMAEESARSGRDADDAAAGRPTPSGLAIRAQRASRALRDWAGNSLALFEGRNASLVAGMLRHERALEREARAELSQAGRQAADMRRLFGKTFYRRQETWVDAEYELTPALAPRVIEIDYLSDAYFQLIHTAPLLARYLGLGDRLLIVHEGNAYHIVPRTQGGQQ